MRFPLLIKGLALGAVLLLLLMVLARIDWLVAERRMRQAEAIDSVAQAMAGPQTLIGPLLQRTCTEEWEGTVGEGKDLRKTAEKREFTLGAAPTQLQVQGDVKSEERYRGLFKVNGFAGQLVLNASWARLPDLQPQRQQANSRIGCTPVRMLLAVSDARGLRAVDVQIDGAAQPVAGGTGSTAYPRGLHVVLGEPAAGRSLHAKLTLDLMGTARLALVPAAGETRWALRSAWPHPSFFGRFLPAERSVGDAGFSARWNISALASEASAAALRGAELCAVSAEPEDYASGIRAKEGCLDQMGVAFIDPVNPYVLTDRAIKYALLFIAMTFGCVALTEVLAARRVHPIQYGLLGMALAVFYLLLLSLSEHIGFAQAYAAASAACVLLLGYYARHMLGSVRAGAAFGAGIAVLYGALWVLLQLELAALVMGSVLLFVLLAAVMVLTRRLDWYAQFEKLRSPAPVPSVTQAGLAHLPQQEALDVR